MIAASEPEEFVPFGRLKIESHPGTILPPSKQPASENLVHRFSQVNIDTHKDNEWWMLREYVIGEGEGEVGSEEELYVKDKSVVWSRGTLGASVANREFEHPKARSHVCSFTVEGNITHALWVNFVKTVSNSADSVIPSVCILDNKKITVYTENGEDFLSALQFKVSSVWNTKFGLLLERYSAPQATVSENNLATLFSLLHPLDEMAPLLIMKSGGSLQYMNDSNLKVVFTSENPSLVVLFDQHTGLHSLWKLRKATPQESQVFCGSDYSMLTPSSFHTSGINPLASTSSQVNHLSFTPATSDNSMLFSFSPMDSIAKIQSPLGRMRSGGVRGTPGTPAASRLNMTGSQLSTPYTLEARLGDSQLLCDGLWEPRPIEPQLTLEYIWTENLGVALNSKASEVESAKRVFLSKDVLGQLHLCYLVKGRGKLMMARLNQTNERLPDTLVGPAVAISAIDAAPLPGIDMVAVLEGGGRVTLYTGSQPVGKVHVAGIQTIGSSSYLFSTSSNFYYLSPYCKRNSLLSSTQVGEAMFDEQVHLLSPVSTLSSAAPPTPTPPSAQNPHVHSLRDPVHNRVTLEFRNGSMFRITLPEVCNSPLVKGCLSTLKCILPREVALQFITQWYSTRNAPGTQDISPADEWQLFSKLLLGCLGYNMNKLSRYTPPTESPDTPVQNKKKRSSDLGSSQDWTYVLNSEHHLSTGSKMSFLLGLKRTLPLEITSSSTDEDQGKINTSALLFEYFHNVLYYLHLFYEEMKLNLLMMESLPLMASLLQQLARDLDLRQYVLHYFKDFPETCSISNHYHQLSVEERPVKPTSVPCKPPSIFNQLYILLKRLPCVKLYPFAHQINPKSGDMIEVVGLLCSGHERESLLLNINVFGNSTDVKTPPTRLKNFPNHYTVTQRCVHLLSNLGYTRRELTILPAGLALVLNDAINRVREDPPSDWPETAYRLIGRQDLATSPPPPTPGERGPVTPPPPAASRTTQDLDDGMDSLDREILKLRFSKDQRVSEVRRLLQSSHPVTFSITQQPEVSDHEFIEEQEKHLYTICTRTMALPIGRGMLTLHTSCPVASEPLTIARLCLTGRALPRGTTVDLTHIDVVPNMNLWPLFHNGVASGLRISPNAANINSAWIIYNKPKGGPEALPEHAGLLMALGLNGHLNKLANLPTCEYLRSLHEMTSIGLLIGIAASKRGTMDMFTTKMLSLHIECLLPPTSVELDVTQNTQVAALLGIGLVYQQTAHRHMTEILLSEMGRPPGPEMENSVDRECYALAAGLGLGMVVLGKGADLSSLSDMAIADTLHYYMVGGLKRPLTGSQKDKYKSPSYQIREGDCVNVAVTGPGATLALGMMYFNTGNQAVAKWMEVPDTQYLLDFVCGDALLLRTLARGLILWQEIQPRVEWVENHVPPSIRQFCLIKPNHPNLPPNVDLETMNQAYFNAIAGACMAMGLRFAGSCNEQAFDVLLYYCNMMIELTDSSIADLAGKSTIETCLNVVICSLAMVMAGSGDLSVMRLCRFLHSRIGQPTVTYGSHLAAHMALGLLFLGGGRYTLSTSPPAIAALLCAFFPKFPTHSNDNRYHLQAFRHLYVLAAEPRLLLCRDIDTGSLCYTHITVHYQDTDHYKNQSCRLKAPCILPELKYLKEVRIEDDRYWNVTFKRNRNWSQLENLLSGCVGVKQRAGCLSYLEDPHGFRSLLAQALTTDKAIPWTVPVESIFSFSSDPSTVNFAHYFLEGGVAESRAEQQVMHFLTNIVYECVTHDKLSIIPIWITIIKAIQSLQWNATGPLIWQLKLMIAHGLSPCKDNSSPSITAESALSVCQQVYSIMDNWEPELQGLLRNYVRDKELNAEPRILQQLGAYLTFHDFPTPSNLAACFNTDDGELRSPLLLQLMLGQEVPIFTIRKIASLIH